MAPRLEGKTVVGCESYAWRLYNNSTVYLSPFSYPITDADVDNLKEDVYRQTIRRLLREGLIDYAFCRLNESRFTMESLGFERLEIYSINKDQKRAMGLYRPRYK